MPLNIHSLYARIFRIWRRRRFAWFLRRLAPRPEETLLDVGGVPSFWTAQPQPVARIDTLNVHPVPWDAARHPHHQIRVLVGDGCALNLGAGEYDIGFSNSVIEHVGSWERQQQFAAELRRVARRLWVQTPAFACPFEPHYLTPFIHYLPPSWRRHLARNFTVWGWLVRPTPAQVEFMVSTTRLLGKAEMRELFPDCDILTERLFGIFPKSYIAVRGGP
jgi:hypothetical protein